MDSPLYPSVTSEFARLGKCSLSLDELRCSEFARDLELRLDHVPTLFCLDADQDGAFSESDILQFLAWQAEPRRAFLPHAWPARCAALCARRLAAAPVPAVAAWLRLLPSLCPKSADPAFCAAFARRYSELVSDVLGYFPF